MVKATKTKQTADSSKQSTQQFNWLNRMVTSSRFGKLYAGLSVLILLATSGIWSLLSAKLHQANADQLVNSYLVKDLDTFHGALFPSAHSLLIKWPLFTLIKLFGGSATALACFTIGSVVVTVGLLAVVLYRIERRPI